MSGQAIVNDGAPQLRRVALLLAATAALVLVGAGIAAACTGRAALTQIEPKSGKAGETVSVSGHNWDEGGPADDAEVELHWRNTEGTPLATPTGPSFTTNVGIPGDASPGTYYIVGVAYNKATGEVEGRDSIAFKVASEDPYASGDGSGEPSRGNSSNPSEENSSEGETNNANSASSQNTTSSSSMSASGSEGADSEGMSSSGSSSASSAPSEGSASSSSPAQGSSTSPSEGSTASSSPSQESAPSQSRASQPDESPQQAGTPDEARSGQPAGRQQERQSVRRQPSEAPTPQGDRSAAPQPDPQSLEPAEQPTEPTQSSGQPNLPDGEPAGDVGAEPEAAAPEAAEPAEDDSTSEAEADRPDTDASREGSHPSARSGSGDLWSGFETGDGTLSPGLDEPVAGNQDGGMSQQLALAVGLFGAGALALMGGGFAALRRRRAVATAGTRRDA